MSVLKMAMPTILNQEGRYVNDSNDTGGPTNYGISLRFLIESGELNHDGFPDGDINHDGKVDINDIKALTEDEATHIYDLNWWSKFNYGLINNQAIATKLLSLAINMGSVPAHKCLQRALRGASTNRSLYLADDGEIGERTLQAVNASSPTILLAAFRSEGAGWYRTLAIRNPHLAKYINGWLNRAYA